MATTAQIDANIQNSQFSTGPRTPEGKAASSQNALKHGLSAKAVLLPGEDEADYLRLCAETLNYWKPANAQEEALVQYLCDTQWRLTRCARLEAAILSAEVPDFKALDSIGRHESRLKRNHSAAFKEVRSLINTRLARQQEDLEDAITIRTADKIKKRHTDLAAIGFDLPLEEVDLVMLRDDVVADAQSVIAASQLHIH